MPYNRLEYVYNYIYLFKFVYLLASQLYVATNLWWNEDSRF